MNATDFEFWLDNTYLTDRGQPLDPRSRSSTMSNCRRVEKHFGDLDEHFSKDACQSLLERLLGSKIRIEGDDPERVKASLRSAVVLFVKYRRNAVLGRRTSSPSASTTSVRSDSPRPTATATVRQAVAGEWPRWPQPDDDAVLRLAQVTAPFVRMLHPDIVRAIVEDNRRNADRWSTGLRSKGVDPTPYLWDGCACAFPGVRRYAGSAEVAQFRGHGKVDAGAPSGALRLDDNDFPKHLWSFVFRGRPFQKFGPDGYALAHLADHKDHGNRRTGELQGPSGATTSWYGLYTSAANAAYSPVALVKPTDHSTTLRNLLLRQAGALYGDFCSLLPPGWTVPAAPDPRWSLGAFGWSEPVGSTAGVAAFLEFRDHTLTELLRGHGAPRRDEEPPI